MSDNYWHRVADVVATVARDDLDGAINLAERLLMSRFDDSRLLRILGDYAGEQIYNRSIKGMLMAIVDALRELIEIQNQMLVSTESIQTTASTMLRHGSTFKAKPSEYAQKNLTGRYIVHGYNIYGWQLVYGTYRPVDADPVDGVLSPGGAIQDGWLRLFIPDGYRDPGPPYIDGFIRLILWRGGDSIKGAQPYAVVSTLPDPIQGISQTIELGWDTQNYDWYGSFTINRGVEYLWLLIDYPSGPPNIDYMMVDFLMLSDPRY